MTVRALQYVFTAALLAVRLVQATELEAGFNTEYLGYYPEYGGHAWQIIFTNLTQSASSDFCIHGLRINTKVSGSDSISASKLSWSVTACENSLSVPAANYFEIATSDSDEYLWPDLATWNPLKKKLIITYTTPTNWNQLAKGTIKVYSERAGTIIVSGLLPRSDYSPEGMRFESNVQMIPEGRQVIGSVTNYKWQLNIRNMTDIDSGDYAGVSIKVNAPDTAGHDYGGPGGVWDAGPTVVESNYFYGAPVNSMGYIYPTVTDPGQDDVTVWFFSPHETLVDSTIEVTTENEGVYIINTQLPGARTFTTNGVPFSWLMSFGFTNDFDVAGSLDSDFDGHANWQEYIADTNPTNALSVLSLSATPTTLLFQTSEKCEYAVEVCTNLFSNNWNFVTNNLPGSGTTESVPITTNFSAFYRLKAERILLDGGAPSSASTGY